MINSEITNEKSKKKAGVQQTVTIHKHKENQRKDQIPKIELINLSAVIATTVHITEYKI